MRPAIVADHLHPPVEVTRFDPEFLDGAVRIVKETGRRRLAAHVAVSSVSTRALWATGCAGIRPGRLAG